MLISKMKDSNLTIRQATVDDAEALAEIGARTFRLGCPPETREEDLAAFIATELTPNKFREHLSNGDATIFLAEANSEIAGFLMLVARSNHSLVPIKDPMEVRKIYVDPCHHGGGVAGALMNAALKIVGEDPCWLSVYSGNARAIAFYKKWGFNPIGTYHFMVGNDPQKDNVMLRQPDKTR